MIRENLREVHRRIATAARRAGRDPNEVKLLAVSKTFAHDRVLEAAAAGQLAFGENRVQEASRKIPAVAAEFAATQPNVSMASMASMASMEWHLIGPLQRNKARQAVGLFDVIHSLDRSELAVALERAAEALDRRPRVLLQINIDDEPQKSGAAPSDARELLEATRACAHLIPIGLMTLPRACSDPEEVRPSFRRLRELLAELHQDEPRLVELSMGMSADFEVAIEEGSTQVRIGTAIFGPRSR